MGQQCLAGQEVLGGWDHYEVSWTEIGVQEGHALTLTLVKPSLLLCGSLAEARGLMRRN